MQLRLPAFVFLLLLLCAGTASAASTATEAATLHILNREIVTFRATLFGNSPAARVVRARERLRQVPPAAIDAPITTVDVEVGALRGVQFYLGDFLLFSVAETDVDAEAQQSLGELARQTRARLEEARVAWHQLQDRPLLLRGLLQSAAGTLVFALLVWAAHRGGGAALRWLEQWRDSP